MAKVGSCRRAGKANNLHGLPMGKIEQIRRIALKGGRNPFVSEE